MSELWFYGQNGTQRGPVEMDALRELAATGALQRGDLVWREGMADWIPAGTVPGLFPVAVEVAVDPVIAPPVTPPAPAAPTTPHAMPVPLAYDPGTYGAADQNGRAVASLVLGICSLPACFCPFIGVALGVTAIVLGVGVRAGPNKGLAVGGVVCGIVGAVLSLPQTGNFLFHL